MKFSKINSYQKNKIIKAILLFIGIIIVLFGIHTKYTDVVEKKMIGKKEKEYTILINSANAYINLRQYKNALEKLSLAEKISIDGRIDKDKDELIRKIIYEVDDLKNKGSYKMALDLLNVVNKIKEDVNVSPEISDLKDVIVKTSVIKAKEEAEILNYEEAINLLKFEFSLDENNQNKVNKLIEYYIEKKEFYETSEGKKIKVKFQDDRKKRIEEEYRKKIAKERQKLEEEERKIKEQKREELKRKKSEGVSIGMTQEEVLQSSWGKPEDINKTITKYGTREQWVYGNNNYLYFEDGILVTIQN